MATSRDSSLEGEFKVRRVIFGGTFFLWTNFNVTKGTQLKIFNSQNWGRPTFLATHQVYTIEDSAHLNQMF